MIARKNSDILLVNPLKYTLAHYEGELREMLQQANFRSVEVAVTTPGDGLTGSLERAQVAVRCVWQRWTMARQISGQTVVVLWPLFGYFEPLTLLRLARRNCVYVIVHDPAPLQRSYGQSTWAAWVFRATKRIGAIEVIYHTETAQRVGTRETGVEGIVVPHPVGRPTPLIEGCDRQIGSAPVVRVLGRFKDTRSLSALDAIANGAAGTCVLEIHGRGWPKVAGWTVNDAFVAEDDFAALVESADCVVIPYDYFFQSGVAVRCLEAGTPIVAPRHEHITQLYGSDWPGIVDDQSAWYEAVLQVLTFDTQCIRDRHRDVFGMVQTAWAELFSRSSATR
ncbi:hypothetical protein [Mycolicibacterium sp. 050158]|uniref:hypothetical protein n=1 Tax=Mycolicibacterium sp. 050158 TaxID=3090602 RepID=UPI00299EAE81|nr:hypothetical protein [Mycolicibacterium sp. 050158]MDX1888195.1 hypothetical protein [Mycolicibacterium sp. 050158]